MKREDAEDLVDDLIAEAKYDDCVTEHEVANHVMTLDSLRRRVIEAMVSEPEKRVERHNGVTYEVHDATGCLPKYDPATGEVVTRPPLAGR